MAIYQDLRHSLRNLGRTPAVCAVAVISLALGIGANTAIFTLINTLMLRPLPVRAPGELVELLSTFPNEPRSNGFSWAIYEHFREANHVFADLVAVSPQRFRVAPDAGEAAPIDGEYISANLFPALGLQAAAGRLIGAGDDRLGSPESAVAVIGWNYWQSRFNRDPLVIGRTMTVDGVRATIVGVAPRAFLGLQIGRRTDLWLPVAMEPLIQRPSRRADGSLGVGLLGRLKPGVTLAQARADMKVLNQWRLDLIARQRQSNNFNQLGIDVESAASGFSGLREQFGRPLLILMAVVGALLLMACTNVASMLIARGTARQSEIAIRAAIGASRAALFRLVLIEALILSVVSAAVGIVVSYAGAYALVRILVSGRPLINWPGTLQVPLQPDARVLLFTVAVALAAGLLAGIAPAWLAVSARLSAFMREGTIVGDGRARGRLGRVLVASQVALSCLLLAAAGIFLEHVSTLRTRDLGFASESVTLVTLDPTRSGYSTEQLIHPYRELLRRLAAEPGIQAATISAVTPISGAGASRPVSVDGVPEQRDRRPFANLNWVGPGYFDTFATPLLAGRDFSFDDEGRQPVAIVSRSMARHYFGDGNPIGRVFRFDGQTTPYEIVGVAGDAKYLDLKGTVRLAIYLNTFQEARMTAQQLSMRTGAATPAAAAAVRRVLRETAKTVEIGRVTTLAEQMDASIVPERLVAALAGSFGAVGALLAAIGLYGLMAFTVARRTAEIGIRMALGATAADIVWMVMRTAGGLVIAGLAVGIPLALAASRIAAAVFDGLTASITESLAIAGGVMIVIGLCAAAVPALRAATVRPMDALRAK